MRGEMSARTALITGASAGLGAHFAALLLDEGYNVVLAARSRERLNEVARRHDRHLERLLVVEMDVTQEASIRSGFDQAEAHFGRVRSIIANAGVNIAGRAADLDVADFDRVMNVNVRGVFLTAREGARRMLEDASSEEHKSIILVSSIGGLQPLQGLVAYSASKAAVVMLARGLAREWMNAQINVNAICPGFIRTELNDRWFSSAAGKRQIESFPRRRLMELAHLDRMISFLAGPDSAGVTGSVFKLDDGQAI
jgi:NAD(P)-dependent dehydrogenase (short-subunit alcohol dehydrogenase family)